MNKLRYQTTWRANVLLEFNTLESSCRKINYERQKTKSFLFLVSEQLVLLKGKRDCIRQPSNAFSICFLVHFFSCIRLYFSRLVSALLFAIIFFSLFSTLFLPIAAHSHIFAFSADIQFRSFSNSNDIFMP